jgi:hypothetical protein
LSARFPHKLSEACPRLPKPRLRDIPITGHMPHRERDRRDPQPVSCLSLAIQIVAGALHLVQQMIYKRQVDVAPFPPVQNLQNPHDLAVGEGTIERSPVERTGRVVCELVQVDPRPSAACPVPNRRPAALRYMRGRHGWSIIPGVLEASR